MRPSLLRYIKLGNRLLSTHRRADARLASAGQVVHESDGQLVRIAAEAMASRDLSMTTPRPTHPLQARRPDILLASCPRVLGLDVAKHLQRISAWSGSMRMPAPRCTYACPTCQATVSTRSTLRHCFSPQRRKCGDDGSSCHCDCRSQNKVKASSTASMAQFCHSGDTHRHIQQVIEYAGVLPSNVHELTHMLFSGIGVPVSCLPQTRLSGALPRFTKLAVQAHQACAATSTASGPRHSLQAVSY